MNFNHCTFDTAKMNAWDRQCIPQYLQLRKPGRLGPWVYGGLSCHGVLASVEGNVKGYSIQKSNTNQHLKQKQAALRGKWTSAPLVPY